LKVRRRSVISIIAVEILVGAAMLIASWLPYAVDRTSCAVQQHGSLSAQCR
jgi:hypothetical protein